MSANSLPGLAYEFDDPELLSKALTHRSHNQNNNERLEFLGDAIVNMVVAEILFIQNPDYSEGELSRLRARIVRGRTLAGIAQGSGWGDFLIMGPGELASGGYRRQSILADAFEAVIGAIFLDGGFDAAREAVATLCMPLIRELPDPESLKDPKTRLQEWLQGRGRPLPEYHLLAEEGKDHAKQFTVACVLEDGDSSQFSATAASRRTAEKEAARIALEFLEGTRRELGRAKKQ